MLVGFESDQLGLFESIASALQGQGWLVVDDFLPGEQVASLRAQALARWQQGEFHAAGIGKGQAQAVNTAIRSDQVLWLDEGETGAVGDYLAFLEQLRLNLNRALLLGAFDHEVHFAVYPPGSYYHKHVDNFRGTSARLVTLMLYLNADWQPDDGGQLRLYTAADVYRDILPQGGRLVLFLSDCFYHEVLPAKRDRISLTGWLRRRV